MKLDFISITKRQKNPRYYILPADVIRTMFLKTKEADIERPENGYSCLENEYKISAKKVSVLIGIAQSEGLNSCAVNLDEEVAEEMTKHLLAIGYFVLAGVCKDGNIKLNIRW